MKNRSSFIFTTVILTLLVIYAFITNVIMPVMTKDPIRIENAVLNENNEKSKKQTREKATNKNVKKEQVPDSLKSKSRPEARRKLLELRKTEKFLQSKLKLVNQDSMYLVLDLENNSAILELKGVPLHRSNLIGAKISNTVKNQPADRLLEWIAEPFSMIKDTATIPKILFIEKIAPKDTVEAQKSEALPTPPKRGDVYAIMDFERNLRLIIKQVEKPDKEGRRNIRGLIWNFRKEEILKSLGSLITLNRELATPTIEIVLPKEDATILYRALPHKPKLLLKL